MEIDGSLTLAKIAPGTGFFTNIATSSSQLNTGRWYRISVAYTITSTTVNELRVYVDGALFLSVTNAALDQVGTSYLSIGGGNDIDWDYRLSDFYIDDDSSLADPGNIWVTAKRPFANNTNQFTTQIGSSGSGYGSGHAPQVNERPEDTSDGWSIINVGSSAEESYQIESASTGDINITGATILGYAGWIIAKSLISESAQIKVNGSLSGISSTSSITTFTKIYTSGSYPSNAAGIGVVTDTTVTTVSLYEAGVIVAFIPIGGSFTVSEGSSVATTRTYDILPTTLVRISADINNNSAVAQIFTPSVPGLIQSAAFSLSKVGSPTGNIIAKLYNISGSYGSTAIPSGGSLLSSSTVDASTLTGSQTEYSFNFGRTSLNNSPLLVGNNYAISVEYSGGDANNYVYVGSAAQATPPGGNSANKGVASGTWLAQSTDLVFSVLVYQFTVSESLALVKVNLLPSLAESTITVSESNTINTVNVISGVNVVTVYDALSAQTELVFVTESLTVKVIDFGSVNDAVSVAESLAQMLVTFQGISPNDVISVAENLTMRGIFQGDSVSDNITVSESATTVIPTLIDTLETISVSESLQYDTELVIVQDVISIAVALVLPVLTDTATTQDILSMDTELIVVQEFATAFVVDLILVSGTDTVTAYDLVIYDTELVVVGEDLGILVPLKLFSVITAITVYDALVLDTERIYVTESLTISKGNFFVSDPVSVAEGLQMPGIPAQPLVSDAVSVSDIAGRDPDTVFVFESATILLPVLKTLTLFDTVTVTETDIPLLPYLTINTFQAVTVSENLVVRAPDIANVSDALTINESTAFRLVFSINTFDNAIVVDDDQGNAWFNGSDAYVNVPDNAAYSIETTKSLSMAFWMRPDILTFPNEEGSGGQLFSVIMAKQALNQNEWQFSMDGADSTQPGKIAFSIFPLSGTSGSSTKMTDNFEGYTNGAVITQSENASVPSQTWYNFANFPGAGSSGPDNISTKWEADTGWLYASQDSSGNKWGYSGRPIDWTDEFFFRLNTQATAKDAKVSFTYKSAPFGQDGFAPDSAAAVDIWLRYQSQYWLYVLQFDRTNDGIVCKKKVPSNDNGQWGGASNQISNKGVYYELFTNANQPIFGAGQQFISWSGVQGLLGAESGKPNFPNLAHDGTTSGGTTYDFRAEITTYDGGGPFLYVQIQLFRGNVLVGSWVDDNTGTTANGRTFQQDWNAGYYNGVTGFNANWGFPIYTTGKSGLRADNIKLWIDNFSLVDMSVSGTSSDQVSFQDTVNAGEWMHIAATTSDIGGGVTVMNLYKNGVLRASFSSHITIAAGTADVKIGAGSSNSATPTSFFLGGMRQALFYNVLLSAANVLSIYNGSPPLSGLVGDFELNDIVGTNVPDGSVTANNGTTQGGVQERIPSVKMQLFAADIVFDAITVTESTTIRVIPLISVFEPVGVTEMSSTAQVMLLSVFETITNTQIVQITPFTFPDIISTVADTVTVSELLTIRSGPQFINVNDSVSIGEFWQSFIVNANIFVSDPISISESPTIQQTLYDLFVSDSISVAENETTFIPILTIVAGDDAHITEFYQPVPGNSAFLVDDDPHVSESVILQFNVYDFLTSETIGLSDAPTVFIPIITLAPFDTVSAGENITAKLSAVLLSTQEIVSHTEFLTLFEEEFVLNVFQTVSVSDSFTNLVTTPLFIFVKEDVSIAEFFLIVRSILVILEIEDIGVIEFSKVVIVSSRISVVGILALRLGWKLGRYDVQLGESS